MFTRTVSSLCLVALLAGCSFDAPNPFGGGGDARVNGAPIAAAARAEDLEDLTLRSLIIEAAQCRPTELSLSGEMTPEALIGALVDMGVLTIAAGSVTLDLNRPNLERYGGRLRCAAAPRAGFDAPDMQFNAAGVDAIAPEGPFTDSTALSADRFARARAVAEGAPIDAGRVRPGDGFFRAQLGVYATYADAAVAWRALIETDRRFRSEPVVVQPAAGAFRLHVLRRNLAAAQDFCDGLGSAAPVCTAGPY